MIMRKQRSNEVITVTVSPESPGRAFPVDMLRYDGAWPATEEDSRRIAESIDITTRNASPVQLKARGGYGAPNAARWQSYGWTVVQVTDACGMPISYR